MRGTKGLLICRAHSAESGEVMPSVITVFITGCAKSVVRLAITCVCAENKHKNGRSMS